MHFVTEWPKKWGGGGGAFCGGGDGVFGCIKMHDWQTTLRISDA